MSKASILAAGVFALILQATGALADDCTPKLLSSLPLIAEPDGRYAIEVAVNGAPHRILLATTDIHTMFFQDFTENAGMRQHELPERKFFYGFGGKAVGYTVADTVSIAGNTANAVQALVIKSGYRPDGAVVGTLGADLLSNFDVDIDFTAGRLSLYANNPCDGKPVYWSKTYTDLAFEGDTGFAVPMSLDGKTVAVAIDPLVPHSAMRFDVANQLFGLDEKSPGIEEAGTGEDGHARYRYAFGALSSDGVSIARPVVVLHGLPQGEPCDGKRRGRSGPVQGMTAYRTCHSDGDMQVGMLDLKATHLYMAYKARRVYFSVASN
ncbi:MAG: hypothetical protein WDM86_20190 [Rhizomicrobium sp.]